MVIMRVISLFCGCGGADQGIIGDFSFFGKKYSKNIFSIIHASDINEKAIKTYNENFKHKSIVEDVRNLNFQENSADLVIGGFPCQNFSTVNPTKDPENKENQLFWELARVVEQVNPLVFIGENVKGFATLNNGKYLKLAMDKFTELGYTVNHEILNAANFGVPQLRERVIIVGIRNDISNGNKFIFPKPTHDVLNGIFNPIKPILIAENEIPIKYYFSERAVQGVKNAKPNMKRALAQNIDKPCLTITSHLAKASLNSRDPVLLVDSVKERYRRFTPREAARIQSFPDNFTFVGSDADAYRQIGNAVPPVLMWHVARQIQKTIKTT